MATMHTGPRRRYAMAAPVEVLTGKRAKGSGLLIELTQDSARISQLEPGRYAPGDAVTVKTPCGRKLEALVQSVIGCRANVRFATALHLPELAQLLDENRNLAAYA